MKLYYHKVDHDKLPEKEDNQIEFTYDINMKIFTIRDKEEYLQEDPSVRLKQLEEIKAVVREAIKHYYIDHGIVSCVNYFDKDGNRESGNLVDTEKIGADGKIPTTWVDRYINSLEEEEDGN